MSQNAKATQKPPQPVPQYVVAPRGTTFFEALNFERYVCPTPKMRMLGYMGTAAFMGFMGYMLYQREEMTKQQKNYRPS